MDTERLMQLLLETTEVFDMPHKAEASSNLRLVDCHFIIVGVDMEEAQKRREELVRLLKKYPYPDRLAGGPSYIEVGAELGSQDLALRLFALGEALKLWEVIIPEKLGITGKEADQLAGGGMVMMTGYKKS